MNLEKDEDDIEDLRFFQELMGGPVSKVCFVMDYVEIGFNGAILRSLSPPRLKTREGEVAFPEPGSRDLLCTLIDSIVGGIEVAGHKWIRFTFDSGSVLTVPLDYESRSGREAAHYVPFACMGRMRIW